MTETRVVGVDVWWDHEAQKFRPKKVDLEKVPLEFRCPNCGKILIGLKDRKKIYIEFPWAQGTAEFLNWVNSANYEIGYHGGVCRCCHLDGFGAYGIHGRWEKAEIKANDEAFKKGREKVQLVFNGHLRFVKGVIDAEYEMKT
jgi:hypothetical protein